MYSITFYLYTYPGVEAVTLTGETIAEVYAKLRVEYPGRSVSYCRDNNPQVPLVRFA